MCTEQLCSSSPTWAHGVVEGSHNQASYWPDTQARYRPRWPSHARHYMTIGKEQYGLNFNAWLLIKTMNHEYHNNVTGWLYSKKMKSDHEVFPGFDDAVAHCVEWRASPCFLLSCSQGCVITFARKLVIDHWSHMTERVLVVPNHLKALICIVSGCNLLCAKLKSKCVHLQIRDNIFLVLSNLKKKPFGFQVFRSDCHNSLNVTIRLHKRFFLIEI